jgi:hypothetical protein
MPTITLNIPDKKYDFLKDDNVFQSIITETIYDYVEKKQDLETKELLINNVDFQILNIKLEKKL